VTVSDPLQPHEGSSETVGPIQPITALCELQPHEGSSETVRRQFRGWCQGRFNPARVRLKLASYPPTIAIALSLQPYEGSSETRLSTLRSTFSLEASTLRGFV